MTQHPLSLLTARNGPDLSLLPFGGLGLDMAEVRRKVSGLEFKAVPKPAAAPVQTWDTPTPTLHGYGLLLRLNRETLGS